MTLLQFTMFAGATRPTMPTVTVRQRCRSTELSTMPRLARAQTCRGICVCKCFENKKNSCPCTCICMCKSICPIGTMLREQKNHMTAWIDGSFIYSTTEPWVALMRSYSNGTLRMTNDGYPPHNTEGVPLHNFPAPHIMKPADPSRMYVLGDPRYFFRRCIFSFQSTCSINNFFQDQPEPSTSQFWTSLLQMA